MAHAIYQFWGAGEMNLKKQNKQKKPTSLACPSVECTFRKMTCETPLSSIITLGLSGRWLLWGAGVAGLLVAGSQP